MLRSLTLTAAFLLGSCASAPDATPIVDAISAIEKNYAERASSADALIAKATGVPDVAKAEWQARASALDEQTRTWIDKVRDTVSAWGKVDWKQVARDSVTLIREARGK